MTQKEKREGSKATGYKVIRLQQIGRSPILSLIQKPVAFPYMCKLRAHGFALLERYKESWI